MIFPQALGYKLTLKRSVPGGRAIFWIDSTAGPGGEKSEVRIEYYALRHATRKNLFPLEGTQDIIGYRLSPARIDRSIEGP